MAIHGPNLDKAKERAKRLVQDHTLTSMREAGINPEMQPTYIMKAMQADAVINGGQSDIVDAEATIRGVTPEVAAQAIREKSQVANQFEINRMKTNVEIDATTSIQDLVALLQPMGITFQGLDA